MTKSLVSGFRLNPTKVLTTLVPECLKSDSPHSFKIAIVNALLQITQEGATTPWTPTISDVYNSVAPKLRSLFSVCLIFFLIFLEIS